MTLRVFVINPNASRAVTDHIHRALEEVKRPDTELTVVNPPHGPASIESQYDRELVKPHVLDLVREANDDGHDAIIIACFSDPGLDAAREISRIPVLGIEESTLHLAAMLGHRFSPVTAFTQHIPTRDLHARMRGFAHAYASTLVTGMSVLDMEAHPTQTKQRILAAARQALTEDGTEVIVLGCAGLSGYARDIERELGVVVLDPTAVALKVAEALADLGLRHSKIARFATPREKEIK
jgi:allantoin racemase